MPAPNERKVLPGLHHNSRKKTCKRGHPLSGENLYINPRGVRNCKTCERARLRILSGWPEDLAYNTPKVPARYSPDNS